jgi:hypothetical protein
MSPFPKVGELEFSQEPIRLRGRLKTSPAGLRANHGIDGDFRRPRELP